MTVTEEEPKKADFTKVFPPAKKEDLPESERWQLEETGEKPQTSLSQEEQEMLNHPFEKPKEKEVKPESDTVKDIDRAAFEAYTILRGESAREIAIASKSDTYHIEMIHGSVITYKRVGPSEMEMQELEDLQLDCETGTNSDGKTLTRRELENMKRLWRQKQAQYYLFNTKTREMMTVTELNNCKYSDKIRITLDSCQMRSMSDGPFQKKSEVMQSLALLES